MEKFLHTSTDPFLSFLRAQADLSRYTLDTYLRIVTYKTAFYTFYLPIACGMVRTDVSLYKLLTVCCVALAHHLHHGALRVVSVRFDPVASRGRLLACAVLSHVALRASYRKDYACKALTLPHDAGSN